MRILTILGSPRREGNTAQLLTWLESELLADGQQVEHIDIGDYQIEGCAECWACKEGPQQLCAEVGDDANALLQRMTQADLVLFATPVFGWSWPARMKALVERMFCLIGDFRQGPYYPSLLQDKRLGLLTSSGGPVEGNAELLERQFENLVGMLKAHDAGHLQVAFCSTPEALDQEETRSRVREFARKLQGENGRQRPPIIALISPKARG